jgi:hypothetical protein
VDFLAGIRTLDYLFQGQKQCPLRHTAGPIENDPICLVNSNINDHLISTRCQEADIENFYIIIITPLTLSQTPQKQNKGKQDCP